MSDPRKPNLLANTVANTLTLFDPFWNAGQAWYKNGEALAPPRCHVVASREALEILEGLVAQFQEPAPGWKALLLAPPTFQSRHWAQPTQRSQLVDFLATLVKLERDAWVMLLPDNRLALVIYHPAKEGLVALVNRLASLLVGEENAPRTTVMVADLGQSAQALKSWAKSCEARLQAVRAEEAKYVQQRQLETVQQILLASPLNPKLRSQRTAPVVMVVEDDPSTGLLLETLLASTVQVVVAKHAEAAAQLYARHMPDVVFLDIGLPDVSGLALLKLITTTDTAAHVVMLTANATQANLASATQAGAKGFLAKPFTRDKLQQAITKACPKV
jgi:CheY-like chemotaxis protein